MAVTTWTKNYDVVLCRCNGLVLLKIQVVEVLDCETQGITNTGIKRGPIMLFILLCENGGGVPKEQWNSTIMRVQVATRDD